MHNHALQVTECQFIYISPIHSIRHLKALYCKVRKRENANNLTILYDQALGNGGEEELLFKRKRPAERTSSNLP